MEMEKVWHQFDALPPEAKQKVVDFIESLQIRHRSSKGLKRSKKLKLAEEPFIGLWKDREDLQNSVSWVRDIRRREWNI